LGQFKKYNKIRKKGLTNEKPFVIMKIQKKNKCSFAGGTKK